MLVRYSARFKKQFKKLPKSIHIKAHKRFALFMSDPTHPLLHNHKLKGVYSGYRSINITGDIRAIYYELDDDTNVFVRIGTHSELYE